MHRVLLVEDEDVLRRTLDRFLARSGRHVRSVAALAPALALLETDLFDLLVTDLVLPGGDGHVLVERASALGMETIVITSYGSPAISGRLAAHGASCLSKPFDLSLLQSTVEGALARRARRTT